MPHFYPYTKKAFENTIVIQKGSYPYPISPFSGVVDPVDPIMLDEIALAARQDSRLKDANLIITFESAGSQIAAVASQALHISYLVARKKKFSLPHEIVFGVETNFDKKSFFVYGDVRNKKILIIDDVVASGSTIKSAILALQKAGAKVVALFTVAAKTNHIGRRYQDILVELEIPLISLIKIKVIDSRVVVS